MPKPTLPVIGGEYATVERDITFRGTSVRLTLKVNNQMVTADRPLDGIGASVAWLKQLTS